MGTVPFTIFDSYDHHQLIPEIEKCPLPDSPYFFNRTVRNTDRIVGTEFAGEVSTKYDALADDAITVNFNGTAGQSFGAFLSPGITFNLTGEVNDFSARTG